MILSGSWAMARPNEGQRIIRSPIYESTSALAILSAIRPHDKSNRLFFDAFPTYVRNNKIE